VRVVVTGGAGFVGSHVADRLSYDGHRVMSVDNLLGGDEYHWRTGAAPLLYPCRADCTDFPTMMRLTETAEVVVHCAAAPHEGLSVFSPAFVAHHTYMSTVITATAAIRQGVRRFVFTSSTARYGDQRALPFHEGLPTAPVDPYGVAKVAAEQTLLALGRAHGMEVVIAVPHNIVGPRQKYDDPYRNVASIMTHRMLSGLPPIIYGDGEQTRSFSFIDDCVEPIVRMVTEPGLNGQVFNIGPDDPPITINRLAEILADLTDYHGPPPIYVDPRPLEVRKTWVSADKARKYLAYEPKTPLDVGLAKLVEWVRVDLIRHGGWKPFEYYLPIELPDAPNLPRTWRDRLF
jgi:UDP-glucose 4-epimerase